MVGLGLSYFLNIFLIVHALRTGRPFYWIFIIMTPVIGPISYIVVELLPEFSNDYRARKALRGIRRTINPDADLRRHEKENRLSGSVDAKRHLAAELVASKRYAEAVEHYNDALTGLYTHDPDLMLGLSQALFGLGDFEKTRKTLDDLIEHNPDFKSSDGHLLYARAIEGCGDIDAALEEFEVVSRSYSGPEAKVHFARCLENSGNNDRAITVYEDILNAADLAPRHFRTAQKQWINAAKDGLRRLIV